MLEMPEILSVHLLPAGGVKWNDRRKTPITTSR